MKVEFDKNLSITDYHKITISNKEILIFIEKLLDIKPEEILELKPRYKRQIKKLLDNDEKINNKENVVKPDYYKNKNGVDFFDFLKEKHYLSYYYALTMCACKYKIRAGKKKGTDDEAKFNYLCSMMSEEHKQCMLEILDEFLEFEYKDNKGE